MGGDCSREYPSGVRHYSGKSLICHLLMLLQKKYQTAEFAIKVPNVGVLTEHTYDEETKCKKWQRTNNALPLTSVCVWERGAFSHRQCGRVRFWHRVHCGFRPNYLFFASSTFSHIFPDGALHSPETANKSTGVSPLANQNLQRDCNVKDSTQG